MPRSDDSQVEFFEHVFQKLKPKTVLDVGAGTGKYAQLIAGRAVVDAIEVWQPNIEQNNLADLYREVFEVDARDWLDFNYDLVIFGDVLEHMELHEAVELWNTAREQAGNIFLSLPIVHYPQHAVEGNPYEVHVEGDFSHDLVLSAFAGIKESKQFKMIGAYLA